MPPQICTTALVLLAVVELWLASAHTVPDLAASGKSWMYPEEPSVVTAPLGGSETMEEKLLRLKACTNCDCRKPVGAPVPTSSPAPREILVEAVAPSAAVTVIVTDCPAAKLAGAVYVFVDVPFRGGLPAPSVPMDGFRLHVTEVFVMQETSAVSVAVWLAWRAVCGAALSETRAAPDTGHAACKIPAASPASATGPRIEKIRPTDERLS